MHKYLRQTLTLFFVLFGYIAFSQLSETHYIPPMTSAVTGNNNAFPRDQWIYISTPSTTDVPFRIIPIGDPDNEISGVVSNSASYRYPEDDAGSPELNGYGQLFVRPDQTSVRHNNKGYIIEAADPIYVSVRFNAGQTGTLSQAGALVSKGTAGLDTEFRVGVFPNEGPTAPGVRNELLSFISVMATENNTQVLIHDVHEDVIIESPSGSPVNVNTTGFGPILNRGESYIWAVKSYATGSTAENIDALMGVRISSTERVDIPPDQQTGEPKPIAVTVGSANGTFDQSGSNGRDIGVDQIVGINRIGHQYIFIRGFGNDDYENPLIIATQNNTKIFIDDVDTGVTLNAGEEHIIEGFGGKQNLYVETLINGDEDMPAPVYAYQGVGGANNSPANQGFYFLPPINCNSSGVLESIADIQRIGIREFEFGGNPGGGINIVAFDNSNLMINNIPIDVYTAMNPGFVDENDVAGNPAYQTYTVTGLFGDVSVQSDSQLYVSYFNRDAAATSGAYYTGFPPDPTVNFVEIDNTSSLGECIPNLRLEVSNVVGFTSSEWEFLNPMTGNFGVVATNNTSYMPTVPGTYRFVGVLDCTGTRIVFDPVVVSSCPDDSDNDGVENILDIDSDNDSVSDCDESYGNVTIDLSDLNDTPAAAEATFDDTTLDNTILNGIIIPTRTLAENGTPQLGAYTTGASNTGGFFSEVDASVSDQNTLVFDFSQPVNFVLTEADDASVNEHDITSGETFVIRIEPGDKAIRLLNPNFALLVDSDFDGFFEPNVSTISSTEIRFRFNPAVIDGASGNEAYTFLADQITKVTFEHQALNTLSSSVYRGKISIRCFSRDTDGDGIPDELDLDSDNDGIPDYIESKQNDDVVTVNSTTDTNGDGIEDIYGSGTDPSLADQDGDGIPDMIDLDSDNDGIFDINESGFGLVDVDNDGKVDTTVGDNGWVDSAENSSADSGVILSTLDLLNSDSDSDNVFNYIDFDSDNDGCNDVIEAGFDLNEDNILDTNGGDPVVIDEDTGLVSNNALGYTDLSTATFNVYSTSGGIIDVSNVSPLSQPVCENNSLSIVIDTSSSTINAPATLSIQWQVLETSAGSVWTDLNNDTTYSGVNLETLDITNIPLSFSGNMYRALLTLGNVVCTEFSDEFSITVNPLPDVAPAITGTMQACVDLSEMLSTTATSDTLIWNSSDTTVATIDANTGVVIAVAPGTTDISYTLIDTNGCTDTSATATFTVFEQPIANSVSFLPTCDIDATDGIIAGQFDASSIESDILNGQDPNVFTITYFDALNNPLLYTDGTNVVSPIRDVFISPNQTITVRITNSLSTTSPQCFDETTITFVVDAEPQPFANPFSLPVMCDEDPTDAILRATFDTSNLENTIRMGQETQDL